MTEVPDYSDEEDLFGDVSEVETNEWKDPMASFYPDSLCTIYNNLERACLEDSILELFGVDGHVTFDQINNITDGDILDTINNKNIRYFLMMANCQQSFIFITFQRHVFCC